MAWICGSQQRGYHFGVPATPTSLMIPLEYKWADCLDKVCGLAKVVSPDIMLLVQL